MFSCLRLGAIAAVPLAVLVQPSAAQDAGMPRWDEPGFKKILSELRVDEITEDTDQVVVRVSGLKADGRTRSHTVFWCGRDRGDRELMALVDLELKTDYRWVVPRGTCDALLAAARWRRDAQGR
jgi:hypothetical protein